MKRSKNMKLASTKAAIGDQSEIQELGALKAAHDSSTNVSTAVITPVSHFELRNILNNNDMNEQYDYLVSLGVTSKSYLLLVVKEDLTKMLPIPQRALLALIENLKTEGKKHSGEKRDRSSEHDKDKGREGKKRRDHHHHDKDEDRDRHESGGGHKRHRSR